MFDDLACGTFFITTSNNKVYLKISDDSAYSFDDFDLKSCNYFDLSIKIIAVKLRIRERRNGFISEMSYSGDSSLEILRLVRDWSSVKVGDFFEDISDQLLLKVTPTSYFNLGNGTLNEFQTECEDLKKLLPVDVEKFVTGYH